MEMERVEINGDGYKLLFSEAQIQERVRELAADLRRAYHGRRPVFVGILNGALFFLADLVREYGGSCEVDFTKLSSYGAAKISSGAVQELLPVTTDLRGRHVVLVEDIIDSGRSMDFLLARVSTQAPASIKVVALLQKERVSLEAVGADFIGFPAPAGFVVGYGLDVAGLGRNLRNVYVQDANTL